MWGMTWSYSICGHVFCEIVEGKKFIKKVCGKVSGPDNHVSMFYCQYLSFVFRIGFFVLTYVLTAILIQRAVSS